MKKKWFLVLGSLALVGIIAAVLVYIFVYNKPQPDYSTKEADFTLPATELFHEFRNDPAVAGAKFNGKVLAVQGNLSAVEIADSLTIAVFAIEEGLFGDEGIRFAFIPEHAESIRNTPPQSAITIKGYCTGFNDTDVIMEHCSLVTSD